MRGEISPLSHLVTKMITGRPPIIERISGFSDLTIIVSSLGNYRYKGAPTRPPSDCMLWGFEDDDSASLQYIGGYPKLSQTFGIYFEKFRIPWTLYGMSTLTMISIQHS